MTTIIPMGGYSIELRPDHYPNGKPCFVAAHPDLPGCVAYADTDVEALQQLEAARRVYLADVEERGDLSLTTTSAHWQLSLTPMLQTVKIGPMRGASPALQTA